MPSAKTISARSPSTGITRATEATVTEAPLPSVRVTGITGAVSGAVGAAPVVATATAAVAGATVDGDVATDPDVAIAADLAVVPLVPDEPPHAASTSAHPTSQPV